MKTFTCEGCGACCRTFPIFASEKDAKREPRIAKEGLLLPEYMRDEAWTYRLFRLPFHEACCFLGKDNRCTIYATRPNVCREFIPGEAQCREARERQNLSSSAVTTP